MNLETSFKIEDLVKSPNIAEMLDEEELATVSAMVMDDWMVDKTSRQEWEDKTAEAIKLALQVTEKKTFPWENASNVKFPLVTIAALQYQARAYPALIAGSSVVKARVIGKDEDGLLTARANRVSDYMSYQILEEDDCWEANMDVALISQAIVGCAFKKTYFDTMCQHNVSAHVLAKDLYIPYFARSLELASRLTHMLYLSKNYILECSRTGLYCKLDEKAKPQNTSTDPLTVAQQMAQGVTPQLNDPAAPYETLEQHRYLDLDGDGYSEPYIVTVLKDSHQVLRIVARYTSQDIKRNSKKEITYIKPTHYFTKFGFIPSPDGGIYDLGFGVLLGPLNESINTILNQLVDAGTLANTAGGFLGRGVKFRSGDNSFRPFEWKRVDSTGDDLRKGVFPLPVRDPSSVLFQTLSLLIDYGERIGMAVDPLVGVNPGQNTPAETSRNMIAEGQRIFGAVFKRTYRSLKDEFRKLYNLNGIYLEQSTSYYSLATGKNAIVLAADFVGEGKEIVPAADPNMITKEQKVMQAQNLKANAMATPGMYNTYAIEKMLLQALEIDDIESILPDPKGPNAIPPSPDTKIVIETMKIEQKNMELKSNMQIKMFDLMQEIEYLRAEIIEKESRAALNYAQADGIESGHQVAAMQTSVALLKNRQSGLIEALGVLRDLAGFAKEKKGLIDGIVGGVAGLEARPSDKGMVNALEKPAGTDKK